MSERSAQFLAIAEAAGDLAARESELDTGALDALDEAAEEVGKSWSKSNLGYQANVYNDGFATPPPGAVLVASGDSGASPSARAASGAPTKPPMSSATSRTWLAIRT
jgi:hypothetical protein